MIAPRPLVCKLAGRSIEKSTASPALVTNCCTWQVAPDLARRLVFPQPLINDVPKQSVIGPRQIADLSDQLQPDPMHAREHEGEPNRLVRGGGRSSGIRSVARGFRGAESLASRHALSASAVAGYVLVQS